MIFQYTFEDVLNRSKTQTRRIVKAEDTIRTADDGSVQAVLRKGRTLWQVGKYYSVQPGRMKKSVGRIEVTSLRQENIQAVSEADAIAEGVGGRAEYLELWQEIHGPHSLDKQVWVIDFKLVED